MNIFVTAFLPLTLFVIMFSLGLGLVVEDFKRIVVQPKAFAVGLLSQMVMLPIVGLVLAISFELPPELALGLVILALCPGGATANLLTRVAHGDVALSISVTATCTLLSVLTMPFMVKIMAGYFLGIEAGNIDVTALGLSMLMLTAAPVVLGMMVRRFAPALTSRVEKAVSTIAIVLVVVVVGAVLASNWTMFIENLPTLGPSVITLNVVMLLVGVLLARAFALTEAQGTAIALETGIQNGALGITVGSLIVASAGEVAPFSVPSGVYGITMYPVCLAFTLWRRDRVMRPAHSGA